MHDCPSGPLCWDLQLPTEVCGSSCAASRLQAAHLLQGWQEAGMHGVQHLDEGVDIPICDRILHSIRLDPIQGDEGDTPCRHTTDVFPDAD